MHNTAKLNKTVADLGTAIDALYDENDFEATLKDALTDLRHLADARDLDFGTIDDGAFRMHSEEAAHMRKYPNQKEDE